jgi:hypothetical protein
MDDWMKIASDNRKWGEHVEDKLDLKPDTYKPYSDEFDNDWAI